MKKIPVILFLLWALLCAVAEENNEYIRIPFEGKVAMKNGIWFVGWNDVVEIDESGASPVYRVNGGDKYFGFSTDFIGLDQTKPEPIRIDGWIRRTTAESNPDTNVRFWMELWFQDGTSEWYNGCPAIPASDAGKWVHVEHVCNPAKTVKCFRVICLNQDCPAPSEFRDINIFIKKPSQKNVLLGKKHTSFAVGGMTVEVASGDGQGIVCGLTDKATGWNFIPQKGNHKNLWRIVLRNKKTGILQNIDAGGKVSATLKKEGLSIRWAETELPEGKLAVTVRARPAEDNLLDWTIQAKLDSEEYSIESIFFPTFAEIQVPGEGAERAIFYPQDTGRLIVDPQRNMQENLALGYGSWTMSMQFLHYAGKGAGFYFCALDGAGYTKNFHVQLNPGQENPAFLVEHILARGTQNYTASWPVRVGCVKGNWYDAAMEYRKWALKQIWCSKGTITQRGDEFPAPLKEIGLWIDWIDNMNPINGDAWRALTAKEWSELPPEEIMRRTDHTGYNTEKVIQNFTDLREYYGVPLADYSHPYLHGFNIATPTYFVPPGLSPAMKALKEKGVYFVPWTSARLFDIGIPRFKKDHAVDYAVIGADNKVKYQQFEVMMVPMCMHTEYWRKQIQESTLRLLNDGFTGIYYDELASTGGEICYSDKHGHPVGGGNYPMVARRKVMEDVHKEMRKAGFSDYFSNGEEASEFLFGVHDSNFLFASLFLDGVPAMQAVYHEYVTSFSRTPGRWMDPYSGWYTSAYGEPSGASAIEELVSHTCRNWSVGVNIGIVRRDLPTYCPEGAEIIRRFAQAYYANREYLLEGRMLRPPVICDSVIQKVSWSAGNWSHGEQPMIYASLWEAPSGSIGLMVANAGVFAAAPLLDLQDTLASESCYRLVDTMTNETLGVISGAEPVFRVPVEGRSPRTIKLVPTQEQVSLPATQDFTVVFDHDFTARRTGDEGRVRFTVDNLAALPMSGTAILAWEGMEPQQQAFSLNAVGRTEVVFPVTVPEKTGKQSFTVTVRASNANGAMEETYTTYIGVKQAVAKSKEIKRYSAPYCKNREIPADAPVITDLTSNIKDLKGPEDLSASARLGWCEDGLLLEFTVQDDCHVEPAPQDDVVWCGDGIQFIVGIFMPDQERMGYANCMLTEIAGKPHVHVFNSSSSAQNIELEVLHDGDKTIYKALMSRTLFYVPFAKGMKLPFTFTVNEADKDGHRGWMQWTPGLCGGYDPDAFGEVLLD